VTYPKDIDSFLPVSRFAEYADNGHIGKASPRFYGVSTDYSQRKTSESYAPPDSEIVARGWRRRRSPGGALTDLSPDREHSFSAPRGESRAHSHHGLRPGWILLRSVALPSSYSETFHWEIHAGSLAIPTCRERS
jgi:hypothetical protein